MSGTRIAVLGAGVVGLSTAVALRLAGYDTRVIANQRISDPDAQADPLFASAYPAASIIMHSAQGEGWADLLRSSADVFGALEQHREMGVRSQRHFELFETPFEPPAPNASMRRFQHHAPGDLSIPIARPGAVVVAGYSFDCHFCDMPHYGPWLDSLPARLGIEVERSPLDREGVHDLDADIVVNCLGSGSHRVFDDIGPGKLLRGILLKAPFVPIWSDAFPRTSYNYTPSRELYPRSTGAGDVYFYPRIDHSILGGTREEGTWNPQTRSFRPLTPFEGPTTRVGHVELPAAIVSLNRELVRQLTGGQTFDETELAPIVGIRHLDVNTGDKPQFTIRRSEAPLRSGATVVHSFGFGGAGVTLSWGAALRATSLVSAITGQPEASLTPSDFSRKLEQIVEH